MRLSLLDLQPGTDYSIQVRGNGGEQGNSEWSPIFLLTTIEDTILPSIPSSVTWVVSGDSFVGKWDPVTTNVNADPITVVRYELELTVSGDTEIVAVPQSTEGNPSFTLTFENNRALFATPRAAVGMRVRAVDNKDLKSNWSSLITATNPAPANPTSVVATAGQDLVSLKWTEATDTDIIGYNVYIGATKLAFVAGTTFIYNTTTYSPTVLTVKSVDKFGQESTGANSNSVTPISPFGSDTTAPGVPTALAAVLTNNPNESGAVAEVTWTMSSPPSDLAGFVVRYRRTGTTNWYQVTTDKDARALTVPLDRSYADYDFQIKAFDWQANESAFSTTATGSGGTNSAPSTPAAPTATANTMMAQVYHNGQKAAGGAMESDVVSYEVHVATSSAAFATSSATYIGTIDATGPVLGGLFPLPATGGTTTQTWYIKVIAVDRGGLKSAASAAVSSGIGLIGATNIIDATITNAKIADLAANKITAGTGIINDITVKSKLTLGDASTVGTIETYDYTNSSGATGAQFSKNGIIIKTGAIEAAALKIQVGENIMPAEYADFEAYPTWYNTQLSN